MSQLLHLPRHTARLTLRALREDDLEHHLSLFAQPEVVRFLYEEPMDRDAARAHLHRRLPARLPDEGEWLNLAVEHRGDFVGEVGCSLVSRVHRQCEIGYLIVPTATGQGFGTEAAAAMVEMCFLELGAHRVAGRIDARNRASARVLERLGMRREAHLRENEFVKGEWVDEAIYALTESEWQLLAEGPARSTPAR